MTAQETKQFFRCPEMRGQVLQFFDDMSCLQCGAMPTNAERHLNKHYGHIAIYTERTTLYTVPVQDVY